MSNNLITMNQNAKVVAIDKAIQSSIKSVNQLAQRDPVKVQGYIQAFLSEFARRPELHVCSEASVLNAFMFSIQIGLKVGGPRPQAALIDYKKWDQQTRSETHELQLQPMYPGLNKLMYETGIVESVNSELILTDGKNIEQYSIDGGTNPKISHKLDMAIRSEISKRCIPNPPTDALEKFLIAAYTVIPLKTGGSLTSTPLDVGYLMRIRQTSKGAYRFEKGKNGQPDQHVPNLKHPWFVWWEKMAKKSSLISASKDLPAVDNTSQLFTAIRFDELQSMGDLKTVEIAEEIGIGGVVPDQSTATQFVSAGIPTSPQAQDGPESANVAGTSEIPENKAPEQSPNEVRARVIRLTGIMVKYGIKSAPDQALVFNALIGDRSKLNDKSIEAAEFLLKTASELWDKLNIKYEANAESVVVSGTDGQCKNLVDIIVHGKTDLLREMVG